MSERLAITAAETDAGQPADAFTQHIGNRHGRQHGQNGQGRIPPALAGHIRQPKKQGGDKNTDKAGAAHGEAMAVLLNHSGDDLGGGQTDGKHAQSEQQGGSQRNAGGCRQKNKGSNAEPPGDAGEQPIKGQVQALPGAVTVFFQG